MFARHLKISGKNVSSNFENYFSETDNLNMLSQNGRQHSEKNENMSTQIETARQRTS